MSLANLTSSQLGQLVELIQQKEKFQKELANVDAALQSLETGVPVPGKRGRKPGRPSGAVTLESPLKTRKRGKRLKVDLLKILDAAGAEGVTVKELAAQLKVKPDNVFSWFYTTGKKIKGIKKVGEAKYCYSA
jgi:hypothetical protein